MRGCLEFNKYGGDSDRKQHWDLFDGFFADDKDRER